MNNMTTEAIIKHSNAFQNDLFSLPVASNVSPIKQSETTQDDAFVPPKKRKSKELNPNAPVFKRKKPNGKVFTADPEVITIDSDSDVEKTKNSAKELASDHSDNDSVTICETENETIELNDSDEEHNLIININQTENVDKIVDTALGRLSTNRSSDEVIGNGQLVTRKRIHWTEATGFPKSWTKEMIRFYTEPCEKNRVFDYKRILSKLKSKPSDWWINREDMMGPFRRRRSFEMCRKCGKFGHIARECTKVDVCYVCGGFNHVFPNCPNTRCLTCGNSASSNMMRCDKCDRAFNRKVLCGLCKQNSHEEFMCPSKWRKHMLLDPTNNETLRLNPKRCCYNCAQSGHFGFECPLTQNSPYPLENPLLTTGMAHIDPPNNDNVIVVTEETADLLGSTTGNTFFGRLSNDMNCRIELCRGDPSYVRIVGDGNNVRVFEEELEKFKQDNR